jgi:hypothetical protein
MNFINKIILIVSILVITIIPKVSSADENKDIINNFQAYNKIRLYAYCFNEEAQCYSLTTIVPIKKKLNLSFTAFKKYSQNSPEFYVGPGYYINNNLNISLQHNLHSNLFKNNKEDKIMLMLNYRF